MKIAIACMLVILLCLGALMLIGPVPVPEKNQCLRQSGVVKTVCEGGDKDIVFELRGVPTLFYINRGLEQGLELAQMQRDLIDREIVILYPDYWTPMDPGNKVRHVSKVMYQDKILFSEID